MNTIKTISLLILIVSLYLWGATYTVSKSGGGQFTAIQPAVNQAGPGDIVEILDFSTYEEQVTIDNTKNGLTLRSKNPTSPNKPTIKYRDRENTHPQTASEALDTSTINFDRNGALRILRAINITFEGIAVDGGGQDPFCFPAVWEGRYDLFHGNAAICLWVCGYTTIRHCDIKNAHFGIAVKDRNEGGIFANANSGDIEPWLVVPLSRYGKVGGHLIEQNRIHDNAYGIFSESAWDMGSTVRYNLIYENHYGNNESDVADMYNEGGLQPGGAFEFKDQALTPWAIYNNTFWHNKNHFIGHWQAGPQHLIFNNIFGELNDYGDNHLWQLMQDNAYKQNSETQSIDIIFVNRMKHCVYDLMREKMQMSQQTVQAGEYDTAVQQYIEVKKTVDVVQRAIIQNRMDIERSDLVVRLDIPLTYDTITVYRTVQNGAVLPGAAVSPFPANAKVGYYPVTFKSTDTASSDFLVPDWDDTVVQRLILDQGWPDAGIVDADGTPADLGAIPKGGIPVDRASIVSLAPVVVSGREAILSFNLSALGTTFTSPEMAYIKLIDPIEFNADSWGNGLYPDKVVAAGAIKNVTINSGVPLSMGQNTLRAALPSGFAGEYAFYELFIEGTGSQGKQVVSSAGFLPYRKLDYYFKVWVMDLGKTDTLDEVTAGEVVYLCIEAYKADGSKFTQDIQQAQVNLLSGFDLHSQNYPDIISGIDIPGGIPNGYKEMQVMFTKVPPSDGLEYVHASGLWTAGQQQEVPFFGVSDAIKILPGPAAQVVFQDPPSNSFGAPPPIIDPGINYDGYLEVYDKFENLIDESVPCTLSVKDNNPNGSIVGNNPITTNTSGRGDFTISVQGNEGDIVTFIVALSTIENGVVHDSADVEVGKKRNQLWIFYTGAGEVIPDYDSTNILQGYAGERLKATIAVIKDTNGTFVLVPSNEKVMVKPMGNDPLKFYESQTAATEQSEFTLVDGKVDVWVSSTVPNDFTGPGYGMTTYPSSNTSLIVTSEKSTRYKIYFLKGVPDFLRAAFYDKNGDGFADFANITYKDTLRFLPDSVILYWPIKSAANQKVITDTSAMTLSADKYTVAVTVDPPFPAVQTSGDGKGQSWHPLYQGGPSEPVPEFTVLDSVGPRLLKGYLYEKFAAGNDTIELDVSELVVASAITEIAGVSFVLIKQGGNEIDLTIIENAGVGNQSTITIAIPDLGIDAPVAGDSIKIYAPGPVVDVPGNKAHENNPPVPLLLYNKPAPIWVFYDDIGSYNPAKKLEGFIYSRLKVTLGVTTDGATIIPKFNEKVTVTPMDNHPLTFYASESAPTEQNEFMLVSGRVDIWVTSAIPNPAGDTLGYGLTARASDSASMIITIDKSTRYKLFFVKNSNSASHAAYYDANGDGFVDSVTVSYADTLNDAPDSMMLYWPDKTQEKKTLPKGHPGMTLSADKKIVVASFDPPFTAVQTWGNGIGQSWHEFNPGLSEPVPEFPIYDSVGPRLLNQAYLLERFDSGNDTLLLEFSEDIRAAEITQAAGVSFILIKPGSEVNLTILDNAGAGNLSNIIIALPDLGDDAPAAGDSIRIFAQGPVRDVPNNRAHQDNPPVPIVIRPKPVPIDSATYWDLDADGIVELLRMKLKKKITITAIEKVDVTFGSDAATADASDITYLSGDSTTIEIMLTDIYATNILKNRTGGAMSAAIKYSGMNGVESADVIDKAAPVISKAHYIAGDFISGTNERKPDKIEVTFTEDVESNTHNEPFLFFNTPTQTVYQIFMESGSFSGSVATVTVDTIIEREYPSKGDSIWINTVAGIEDGLNNVQSNEKNRKVEMDVDPQPYNLIIKAVTPVAPKEYDLVDPLLKNLDMVGDISFTTGVYIRVDPQTENDDEGDFFRDASVKIIDAVGNRIAVCEGINKDNGILAIKKDKQPLNTRLHVFWSGQNENKRYVGHGVYILLLEITDKNGAKVSKKLSIGVKEIKD